MAHVLWRSQTCLPSARSRAGGIYRVGVCSAWNCASRRRWCVRSRSGLGCTQVTGLAEQVYCRCTHPVMSPAAKSHLFRSCLASLEGHSWELEQCGRWQGSADGQHLALLFDCGGKARKVFGGSSPVVRESQQRETILVGLSLSRGLASIL